METVFHFILKGFNWILAGLLSLLGFSVTSCGATDEYGSPYAEYELKGKVTDMNGDPIQGIEINYGGIYNNVLSPSYISEIYKSPQTQKDGSYDIKFEDSPMGIVRIIAKGEFYQFNLSSCIRQQNSLTAQFVSFSLSNLANIFYPPQFLQ